MSVRPQKHYGLGQPDGCVMGLPWDEETDRCIWHWLATSDVIEGGSTGPAAAPAGGASDAPAQRGHDSAAAAAAAEVT